MPEYHAPLRDMRFVFDEVLDAYGALQALPTQREFGADLGGAILEEAAKLAENVLAPVNGSGDKQGCQYDPMSKTVKTPEGFKAAYKQFAEGGWTALACTPEFGGQGLPHVLNMMVEEMVCSANLSLGMYPGLTHGAINALTQHGTREQQEQYLPQLISGEWTGTMCLTEPQCGTDLGLIRTRAVPQADGSYAISGTKIWITGGEQDLVDNIIHLVLAKLPDAPDSVKGISLFLVPKRLDDGQANAVQAVNGHAQKTGKSHSKNGYVDAVGIGVFVCFFEQRKGNKGVYVARKAFDNIAHQRARKGKIQRAASGGFKKIFYVFVSVFVDSVGVLQFYGKRSIGLGRGGIFVAGAFRIIVGLGKTL